MPTVRGSGHFGRVFATVHLQIILNNCLYLSCRSCIISSCRRGASLESIHLAAMQLIANSVSFDAAAISQFSAPGWLAGVHLLVGIHLPVGVHFVA